MERRVGDRRTWKEASGGGPDPVKYLISNRGQTEYLLRQHYRHY